MSRNFSQSTSKDKSVTSNSNYDKDSSPRITSQSSQFQSPSSKTNSNNSNLDHHTIRTSYNRGSSHNSSTTNVNQSTEQEEETEQECRAKCAEKAASQRTTPMEIQGSNIPYLWFPSLQGLKQLDYVRRLECEFESLQNGFLALTTKFALMQFRLRQIIIAEPKERYRLLIDLERLAFEGANEKEINDELPRMQRDLKGMGDIRSKQHLLLQNFRNRFDTLADASQLLADLVITPNDINKGKLCIEEEEEDDDENKENIFNYDQSASDEFDKSRAGSKHRNEKLQKQYKMTGDNNPFIQLNNQKRQRGGSMESKINKFVKKNRYGSYHCSQLSSDSSSCTGLTFYKSKKCPRKCKPIQSKHR